MTGIKFLKFSSIWHCSLLRKLAFNLLIKKKGIFFKEEINRTCQIWFINFHESTSMQYMNKREILKRLFDRMIYRKPLHSNLCFFIYKALIYAKDYIIVSYF
ncbi:hypothetical protein BpHYR1_038445 [Brachionus plicatilis]|uniref:Uncharacterized protein n=1 Tax=Brachionus plicatilis TaxID=10195 RepID=A0A3M7Q6Y2_BRAPC|nr:hypothetical protein BpHYR1_038445 [Brachionus plicatilis]